MSALSDFIASHMPEGWQPRDLIRAVQDTMDRTTVYRYLNGKHPTRPSDTHLQAFAKVLEVSIQEIRAAAGVARGESTRWEPPDEAHRLSFQQRRALDEFIRATVAAQDAAASTGSPAGPLTDDEVEAYVKRLRAAGEPALADRLQRRLKGSSDEPDHCHGRH